MEQIVNKLIELKDWLQGKKTYLVAIFAFLVMVAESQNMITHEQSQFLLKIVGVTAIVTIGAKINRKQ